MRNSREKTACMSAAALMHHTASRSAGVQSSAVGPRQSGAIPVGVQSNHI